METLNFPGGFQDQAGYEAIRWRVQGSSAHPLSRLNVFTTIRGIDLGGADLRRDPAWLPGQRRALQLSLALGGATYQVTDDWFEDGVQRLEQTLPPGTQLVCCVTCLFSDYSPAGHDLTGIRCHREAKEQYLAVRSKADYWPVPVTEEVPETYLCAEYRRRVPGTGYRG